jgi:DNA-directed RNA polymerase subunit RPC12/RpoP
MANSSSTNPAEIHLEVLRCTNCDRELSLLDKDLVQCDCGTKTAVPEKYRNLVLVNRLDGEARVRAEKILKKLDTPPWLFTRILAAIFDQSMLGFWIFFGVPVGVISILGALVLNVWIARVFHLASADDVPFAVTLVLILLGIFILAFVPRAFGVYANRRASAGKTLVAALSSHPPKTPGGLSRCRECGAPLTVAESSTLSRCVYCGTDNLVRIDSGRLQTAVSFLTNVVRTMEAAAAMDRKERGETRHTLLKELGRYAGVTAVFCALFVIYAVDTERAAVKSNQSTPVVGMIALVVAVLFLIGLMIYSTGRSSQADDTLSRRTGNGLPGWIRIVGPIVFWIVVWTILRLM